MDDLISVMANVDTAEKSTKEKRDSFREEDASVVNVFEPRETVDEDIVRIIDLTEDNQLDVGVSSYGAKPVGGEINVKEEFIIVENPDYQTEDFKGFQESIENVDVLPPPLTLDDPRPPRNTKRRTAKTSKNQQKNRNLPQPSHLKPSNEAVSQRLYRTCKNKITDYSEDGLMDWNSFLMLKTEASVTLQGESAERQHSCDLCGASFHKACGLKRHQKWKHATKPNVSDPARVEIKFDGDQNSEVDVKQKLSINTVKKTSGKKRFYPCPRCGRQFSFWGNMRRHLQIHLGNSKKYECPHCGKLTTSKQGLIGHIRYIHTGERPFICKVCSMGFATNSDLNRHKSRHSDVRKFKCPDCGKSFKQRSALTQHIQRKVREKSWHCGVCAKRFSSKNLLKCHMVVHTNIKLFECESCQRQFSHKASLEAHMRVHAGLMPFVCSVCGKKFAHLSNRNRHKRQVHK